MEIIVNVEFHEHGFIPGKDVSNEELEVLRSQMLAMHNIWADGVNRIQDNINATWEQYEEIKRLNDGITTTMCKLAMDIDENSTYYDWCERWYKEAAKCVDLGFMDTRLRSRIFRDGEYPIYGVMFADHPDWTMNFTIKEVK